MQREELSKTKFLLCTERNRTHPGYKTWPERSLLFIDESQNAMRQVAARLNDQKKAPRSRIAWKSSTTVGEHGLHTNVRTFISMQRTHHAAGHLSGQP